MNDRTGIDRNIAITQFSQNVVNEVKKTMFDLDDIVRLCMVAILTRGHVLLEGNPGLGKTALVRALSESLKLKYGRIQFTPDLMPSDITGTEIPDETRALRFRPGPIFKTLLLADEINRASPKTQAAMLEAMAERQVTSLGHTYRLPVFFTVLATENPIDHEGTYALPEAQSDRFMFKVILKPQRVSAITQIIRKNAGTIKELGSEFEIKPIIRENGGVSQPASIESNVSESDDLTTQARLREHYQFIREVELNESSAAQSVARHINNLYMASNRQYPDLFKENEFSDPQKKKIMAHCDELLFGLGPRAMTALTLAVKAWSLMFPEGENSGKPYALEMAKIARPVLRHRVKRKNNWEEIEESADEKYLTDLILITAPARGPYSKDLEKCLNDSAA